MKTRCKRHLRSPDSGLAARKNCHLRNKRPPQSTRSAISVAISSMQAPTRLRTSCLPALASFPVNDRVYKKTPLYTIHLQTRHGKGAKTPERPPRLQGIGPPRAVKCKRGKPGTAGRRVRGRAGAWTAKGCRPSRAKGGYGRRRVRERARGRAKGGPTKGGPAKGGPGGGTRSGSGRG